MDLGEGKHGLWFCVVWDDLPDECDWTWQSASFLYADIPEQVLAFLNKCEKKKLVAKT